MAAPAEILMCPPRYYGIEYEINPWMNRQRPSDGRAAAQQWDSMRRVLEDHGTVVHCLTPMPGLPDLVFTANAGLIYKDLAILSHFRHPERQGEEAIVSDWLSEHGFRLDTLSPGLFFEGAGDALFCGDTLFAGYRIRSDIRGFREIGDRLKCRVISLELVDRHYYHLDTCFCPLAPGVAIYYPPAFDAYGRKVLNALIGELIPVGDAEAASFACNRYMSRKGNSQRADLWRERLARQALGPWSVAEFCRREGVSQPSFHQWRKRLAATRPRGRTGPSRRDATDVEFVAVELPASLSRTGIEIDLPSGAVVRLPGDATREMIATAVQAACGSRDTQEALG